MDEIFTQGIAAQGVIVLASQLDQATAFVQTAFLGFFGSIPKTTTVYLVCDLVGIAVIRLCCLKIRESARPDPAQGFR